jgi:1,2-phenylacetyl-CoA epoxidase catalytic subunit
MQAHYGHARALYGYLSKYGLTRADAEWNRSAQQIRSSDLLDHPPQSWPDLIVSTYLVERAVATLLGAYEKDATDEQLAGLAAKIRGETQFHFSYLHGWLKLLAGSRRDELERSVATRMDQMLRWWGPEAAEDLQHASGQRTRSRRELRDDFLDHVRSDGNACGFTLDAPMAPITHWDPRSMRVSREGLPPKLFELIRFKHTELAMP